MTPAELMDEYPALAPLVSKIIEAGSECVVVIDGNSAAGKSTLGKILAEAFDANLYHTDDYFLPPERKTPQRLAQIGGNVDHERMKEEITGPLSEHRRVSWRRYNCSDGTLGEYIRMPDGKVSIIEGVYSCHPELVIPGAVRVLLTLEPELQRERILARNGEYILSRYEKEWLPLEERYFSAMSLEKTADFIFTLTKDEKYIAAGNGREV